MPIKDAMPIKEQGPALPVRDLNLRRTSIAAGTLFVGATVASLSATAIRPDLTGAEFLTTVADQPRRMAIAAILSLIAAGGSAGIAIALYPVLKRHHPTLAMGAVVFRAVEAVFYSVAVVSLLSIGSLALADASVPVTSRATDQTIAASLLDVHRHASLTGVFAFSLGAFLYYVALYREPLVPRWLSGWGIAGAALMAVACLLALFNDRDITGYVPLALPIAVQELVLAGWLLVRGFSPPASAGHEVLTAT